MARATAGHTPTSRRGRGLPLLMLLLLLLLYYRYSARRVNTTEVGCTRRSLSAITTVATSSPLATLLLMVLLASTWAIAQLLRTVVLEVPLGVGATTRVLAIAVVRVCHRVVCFILHTDSTKKKTIGPGVVCVSLFCFTCTLHFHQISVTLFTILSRGHSNRTRNPL